MCFIKKTNSAFYQYLAGFSATLAIVISGMQYGWPAPTLPYLLSESSHVSINEDLGYWLATGPLFGGIVGALSTPLIVDRIGRHKSILLTAVPYVISWVTIFFSTSFEMLMVARVVGGISDGLGFCAIPMYIGEIAAPKIRGLLGSSVSVAYIVGILLIDIIGSYCTMQITALIACILSIVMVVIFFFMPESPYYLIMKGKHVDAKKELQILRGTDDVEKEMTRIQDGIQEENSKKSNPFDLVKIASNRKALIVLLCVRACQELSGDSAITFYSQNIFKEAGTAIPEDLASIIFFVVELLISIVAAALIDRSGRRPLLIFSAAGSAIALLAEGIYFYFKICTAVDLSSFSLVPLAALICFVICFSAGLKVVAILFLGELFPPGVKAAAVSVADISGIVMITCVSKFFQVTRDNFGMYVPFISFGSFCSLGLVYIIFCVPETKGKTLEEIQDYFRGKKARNEEAI